MSYEKSSVEINGVYRISLLYKLSLWNTSFHCRLCIGGL